MERIELILAVSLHFAIFATASAADSHTGGALIFGGISAFILITTILYEIIAVDGRLFRV